MLDSPLLDAASAGQFEVFKSFSNNNNVANEVHVDYCNNIIFIFGISFSYQKKVSLHSIIHTMMLMSLTRYIYWYVIVEDFGIFSLVKQLCIMLLRMIIWKLLNLFMRMRLLILMCKTLLVSVYNEKCVIHTPYL